MAAVSPNSSQTGANSDAAGASRGPETSGSTDASTRSGGRDWLLSLIPSVVDLLFITLLFGLSCGALGRLLLRDADIGWHIRNGQDMLRAHAVARVDSFSSTMSGHTWYAWEWLYDVAIAVVHHVFGLNGVVFYTAAIIAATFVLTLHLGQRRGGSLPVTLLLLILALGASTVHFLARPHVVSWLFSVIWFEVLDTAENRARQLFWLPLLMVLWVNLHGGFVMGFLLLTVYLLGAAVQYVARRDEREQTGQWLRSLGLCTGLSFIASFLNPYGYHLHIHVLGYLSDRFLMNQISEFLSPDFHGVAQQCFVVLLLVTLIALASAPRKPDATRVLLILFAAYSGLYATRNLPTSSLLLVLMIAPLLSQGIAEGGRNPDAAAWLRRLLSRAGSFGLRMGNLESQMRGHLWLVLAFVLGLWACAHDGRLGSTPFINAYFDGKRFPVEAAEAIARNSIREPIFSLDYWGGYLIYRLYPETKVVVDDRHDLYGDQFFKDYLKVVTVQPGWEKVLHEKHVNWVLLPSESSLANMMRLKPEWLVADEDRTAVLFHRR